MIKKICTENLKLKEDFLFNLDSLVFMVIQIMRLKHQRHNLLHFMLAQERVHLREVGLELVRQFYIRQAYQQRFLVKV